MLEFDPFHSQNWDLNKTQLFLFISSVLSRDMDISSIFRVELSLAKLAGIDKGVWEVLTLNMVEHIVTQTVLVATQAALVQTTRRVRTLSDVLHQNFPTLS